MPLMNKLYIVAALVVIAAIGGYWYMNYQASTDSMMSAGDLGTYPYQCDTGGRFSMSPSADTSSITLIPKDASFAGTVVLSRISSTAGARYEGSGIVFIGAGEGVQLTVGNTTEICNPVPNSETPPWNWGDAGEGGGVKQDASLIVSESILGKWQSVDDEKFVREFKAENKVDDIYEGKVVTSGMWVAYQKGVNAPEVPFPLEESTVYLQLTLTGSQADTLNFKLVKLSPDELELVYLDRGGVLRFKSVQ